MSELCMRVCQSLIRMEIALAAGGLLVLCVIRFFPLVSPRFQRALIVLALLQGCLCFRIPLTLPTLSLVTSSAKSPSALVQESELEEVEAENALVAGFKEWLERSFISKTPTPSLLSRFAFWAVILVSVWSIGVTVITVSCLRGSFLNHILLGASRLSIS